MGSSIKGFFILVAREGVASMILRSPAARGDLAVQLEQVEVTGCEELVAVHRSVLRALACRLLLRDRAGPRGE
jgi:hypothetical protein